MLRIPIEFEHEISASVTLSHLRDLLEIVEDFTKLCDGKTLPRDELQYVIMQLEDIDKWEEID